MDNEPNRDEPHVFREVVIPPVTNATGSDYLFAPGAGYVAPPIPMSVAPQCGLCHRSRDDRLHLAAEQNDSERWPV